MKVALISLDQITMVTSATPHPAWSGTSYVKSLALSLIPSLMISMSKHEVHRLHIVCIIASGVLKNKQTRKHVISLVLLLMAE